MKLWYLIAGLLVILVLGRMINSRQRVSEKKLEQKVITVVENKKSDYVFPVEEFEKRITKKTFGMYVTPSNSPVKPERFIGYHTGVDVEYGDVISDVPIKAIADGNVVVSRQASGYGGVVVIKHGEIYAIYGHLRLSSMVKERVMVTKGEQIGVLGKGFSSETDGERKHLHFGISKTNSIKGYTATKTELENNWIDPMTLWI